MPDTCAGCRYFRRHYVKSGRGYAPIAQGHCVHPRLKDRTADAPGFPREKRRSGHKSARGRFSVRGRFRVRQKVRVRGASVKEEKVAVTSVRAKIWVLPSPGW